jgi:hypothetical protein
LKGKVNIEDFLTVARGLPEIYPLINCKIASDKKGISWFESTSKPFEGTVVERVDDKTNDEVIYNEINSYFNVWNGPLGRLVLVYSETQSEIILFAHHVICDGKGLIQILDYILSYLEDPTIEFEPSTPEEVLPTTHGLRSAKPKFSLSTLGSFIRFYALRMTYRSLALMWHFTRFPLDFDDRPLYTNEYFIQTHDTVWFENSLSEQETENFIRLCKEKKISVNTVLCAAFLYARSQVDPERENNKQMMAADLRKHLGPGASKQLSCCASLIYMGYAYDHSKGFWENAQAFGEVVTKQLSVKFEAWQILFLNVFPSDLIEAIMIATRIQAYPKGYAGHPLFDKMRINAKTIPSAIASGLVRIESSFLMTNMGIVRLGPDNAKLSVEKLTILTPSVENSIPLTVITTKGRLFFGINISCKREVEGKDYQDEITKLSERFKTFITEDIFNLSKSQFSEPPTIYNGLETEKQLLQS